MSKLTKSEAGTLGAYACNITRRQIKQSKIEQYYLDPKRCQHCSLTLSWNQRHNKFCSRKCSRANQNILGIHKGPHSIEHNQAISIGTKKATERVYTEIAQKICSECNKIFFIPKNKKRKYCGKKCQFNALSKFHSSRIINFNPKGELFSYKHISIPCDSNLEKAAIIYLVDYLNISSISRMRSILTFSFQGKTKRFCPDFITKINNTTTIIEVKQVERLAFSFNNYKQLIPIKKKILTDWCAARSYNLIWLDPDYDIIFKNIYTSFQK